MDKRIKGIEYLIKANKDLNISKDDFQLYKNEKYFGFYKK